jgi:S1-C subfamily serine protease
VISVESTDETIEVLDLGNSITLRVSGRLRNVGSRFCGRILGTFA